MNHRYSYCKKETQSLAGGGESPEEDSEAPADMEALQRQHMAPSLLDSDERGSSTREDEESEDEEEEGVLDMDDIQVVQIGDEGGDEEEEEQEERNEKIKTAVEGGGRAEETAELEEEGEADTRGEEEVLKNAQEEESLRTEGGVTEEAEVTEESRGQSNRSTLSEDEQQDEGRPD